MCVCAGSLEQPDRPVTTETEVEVVKVLGEVDVRAGYLRGLCLDRRIKYFLACDPFHFLSEKPLPI